MDRSQLVTIVATVAITVVVKELTSWFVSFAKGVPKSDRTRAAAKRIFSKKNRKLIWTFFWAIITGWVFFADLREAGPVTRLVVVRLIFVTSAFAAWLMFAIVEIGFVIQDYLENRRLRDSRSTLSLSLPSHRWSSEGQRFRSWCDCQPKPLLHLIERFFDV